MPVHIAKNFAKDTRGATAILFALVAVPAITFVGAAIDYGQALSAKTRLQAATDVAVAAGAGLPATANQNRSQAALAVFNSNMTGANFAATTPVIQASNSGVTVTASATVPTAFMGVVGINSIEVTARAKARSQIQNGGVACLLALNPSTPDGLHMQGINKVSSPDCWAWVNSTNSTSINATGAASGTAQGFCTAGQVSGAEHFHPTPYSGCDPMADPFYAKFENFNVPTGCTANNLQLSSGTHTLQPGVYCGNTIIKPQANVTLAPGLYVMRDGYFQVQANSSVTGNGVTLFFYGQNTKMEVRGGGSLDLKAPTSGDLAGFVIVDRKFDWYDPSIRETVI
ncbi:MAG TPA: TadE/TadG family type IV pilus assembly protein [Hyphomicrobiaceae bacterium]|nr:TadE/TadG family type IV pilus assembly protein [Hyphomicrobiaceae bacterium]